MFRVVQPGDPPELPMRMLFHPVGDGVYLRACEADNFRALVAAILNDPAYETGDPQSRLTERLRIAHDMALLAELEGRQLRIADREGPETIVVVSDEPLLRSLERLGFVSLAASARGESSP